MTRKTVSGNPTAGADGWPALVAGAPSAQAGLPTFGGFPKDTVTFLRALARNNNEEWLQTNRARYGAAILTPARGCVLAVGDALHAAGCPVVADPRVNGSIFRMARDRRFRPDALPYKTHLALMWWSRGARMTTPGFYIQIDGKRLEFGVGLPEVPREQLPAFRRWLVTGDHAVRFLAAVDVASQAGVEWSLRRLARPPIEFRDLDGPRAEAVRVTGGWGSWTLAPHPPELFSAEFAGWLVTRLRPLVPFWRIFSEALTAPSR